ncbi:MAG: N-6 DNA methylase, partial [Planctomycetes bacterium]|nr:N-6 DNA methylase [Planctomycetota bacterium]
ASLLRLVFLLYAEDQGLMPDDPVYQQNYAVSGLFTRLRDDAAKYPDTMDQRFGAWGWLLSLFRLVHDGSRYRGFNLPARYGKLFDPEAHPFLEGRARGQPLQAGAKLNIPRVSDGCIFRVLSSLLLLKGERLSYRSLDVEQIGSVYEAVMGFEVERAKGRSIGVRKPKKGVSVDVVFDVDELLLVKPADRAKRFAELTDSDLPAAGEKALKEATTVDEIVAALAKRKSRRTPDLLPPGALYLQPGEERRRTGSHYTPRSLTEPIVRKTLEPILNRLGDKPTPAQILDLKICDPAMGSGAFLVEACRQLAEHLVRSWDIHKAAPKDMLGEEPRMHARRLVAQRCLYGVDKNPFAVDLAKLSLWLVTLAKRQPFTFLDHALRAGDSLVGLSRLQIARFHWDPKAQREIGQKELEQRIETAATYRMEILDGGDYMPPLLKAEKLRLAEAALDFIRTPGDLLIAAFFGAEKPKAREALRDEYLKLHNLIELRKDAAAVKEQVQAILKRKQIIGELRGGDMPVTPFHWEIEFPEVFGRHNAGFDAFVGNPPFMGGSKISSAFGDAYLAWCLATYDESHGNADLVALFFRRAFDLMRQEGRLGLIASKTVGQGDTRSTGLRWMCTHGGAIYSARKRCKWPGYAAVVVSIVHVVKGDAKFACELDGRSVPTITAYLFQSGSHEDPHRLAENESQSSKGYDLGGPGFTFDDAVDDGSTNTIDEMRHLLRESAKNAERIFPHLGGEEVMSSPTQSHHRFAIDFADLSEEEARSWPELMKLVEVRVRPIRVKNNREAYRKYWWQYAEKRPGLRRELQGISRALVTSRVGNAFGFAFVDSRIIFGDSLVVIALPTWQAFSTIQSRIHEVWARFFASSMKDDLRYTPSDCFETFPFSADYEIDVTLENVGKAYYEFRANLMVHNNEGLTKTYNRFHDPGETSPDIDNLRELHAAMDRAVLDAYGWQDIKPVCGFGLDYVELDDEADTKPSAEALKIIDGGQFWFPTAAQALQFAGGLGLSGKKRLPWRYRWPEETRDEVLAKLLELNAQRAKEEQQTGAAAEAKEKKAARKPRKSKADGEQGRANMFS